MANQWFQFRQFTIHQDRTAMKVGTDGVLIGAWASLPAHGKILDVGTGTGLIALMAAQRCKQCRVWGVEIAQNAAEQALQNVQNSQWSKRIVIENTSLQQFAENNSHLFDAIISNPPYFDNTKTAAEPNRSLARHNKQLTLQDFFACTASMLTPRGTVSLMLPADMKTDATGLAEHVQLNLHRITYVKPTPYKQPHRVMMEFSREIKICETDEIVIEENGRHQYSREYEALTRDFYLFF